MDRKYLATGVRSDQQKHKLFWFGVPLTLSKSSLTAETTENKARGDQHFPPQCPSVAHRAPHLDTLRACLQSTRQLALTPLLRDVMATTGDHWLVLGLYLSALLSSVVSSLPPTA